MLSYVHTMSWRVASVPTVTVSFPHHHHQHRRRRSINTEPQGEEQVAAAVVKDKVWEELTDEQRYQQRKAQKNSEKKRRQRARKHAATAAAAAAAADAGSSSGEDDDAVDAVDDGGAACAARSSEPPPSGCTVCFRSRIYKLCSVDPVAGNFTVDVGFWLTWEDARLRGRKPAAVEDVWRPAWLLLDTVEEPMVRDDVITVGPVEPPLATDP